MSGVAVPIYRVHKGAALAVDPEGFNRMLNNLSPENRKPALRAAMIQGGAEILGNIRRAYKRVKPNSNLDSAVVMEIYPSGEGAVVRRFYVKGGVGDGFPKDGSFFRSYILNFVDKGATDRRTKGKGKKYRGMRYFNLSRGSIPASNFFSRGRRQGRSRIYKRMERTLLVALANQARK